MRLFLRGEEAQVDLALPDLAVVLRAMGVADRDRWWQTEFEGWWTTGSGASNAARLNR